MIGLILFYYPIEVRFSSFNTACYEGDLRLLNETSDFNNSLGTYRGQLVVCVNGTYQPICDIGWDNNDARVACVIRYGPRFGKRLNKH